MSFLPTALPEKHFQLNLVIHGRDFFKTGTRKGAWLFAKWTLDLLLWCTWNVNCKQGERERWVEGDKIVHLKRSFQFTEWYSLYYLPISCISALYLKTWSWVDNFCWLLVLHYYNSWLPKFEWNVNAFHVV